MIAAAWTGLGHTTLASPATPAMVAEVLTALDRGDAQNAARLSEAALREPGVSPSQKASLLYYRGLARELLGEHDAALADLTEALDIGALAKEEREQALLQRGFLRDSLGRWNQALADYGAAAALKGAGSATALNNRANIYRRQNRLKEAQRDYLAALATGGGKVQYTYYGLGQIAEAQHDEKSARDFYIKAAIADPDYAAAAERLTALGAPPTGFVLPQEEQIILRPPPASQGALPGSNLGKKDVMMLRQASFMALPALPKSRPVLRPALDKADAPSSPSPQIQLGA